MVNFKYPEYLHVVLAIPFFSFPDPCCFSHKLFASWVRANESQGHVCSKFLLPYVDYWINNFTSDAPIDKKEMKVVAVDLMVLLLKKDVIKGRKCKYFLTP